MSRRILLCLGALLVASGCVFVRDFDEFSFGDAGVDGGTEPPVDAAPDGPMDSGTPDSGTDASAMDASAMDASAMDASATDASATDASADGGVDAADAGGCPTGFERDPSDRCYRWTTGPSMPEARWSHASVVLSNGDLAVLGGGGPGMGFSGTDQPFKWTPGESTWDSWPSGTGVVRRANSAAVGGSGVEVVIVGGEDGIGGYYNDVHFWTGSFSSGTWGRYRPAATPANFDRLGPHHRSVLSEGRILMVGRYVSMFIPGGFRWQVCDIPAAQGGRRDSAFIVELDRDDFLIGGGASGVGAEASVVGQPSSFRFRPSLIPNPITEGPKGCSAAISAFANFPTPSSPPQTFDMRATRLGDGTVLAIGGYSRDMGESGTNGRLEAIRYDPAAGAWTTVSGGPGERWRTEIVTLADGSALTCGGRVRSPASGALSTDECWIFDPDTGWAQTASMPGGTRDSHEVTVLPDGRVAITGGFVGPDNTRSDELLILELM